MHFEITVAHKSISFGHFRRKFHTTNKMQKFKIASNKSITNLDLQFSFYFVCVCVCDAHCIKISRIWPIVGQDIKMHSHFRYREIRAERNVSKVKMTFANEFCLGDGIPQHLKQTSFIYSTRMVVKAFPIVCHQHHHFFCLTGVAPASSLLKTNTKSGIKKSVILKSTTDEIFTIQLNIRIRNLIKWKFI